jgi:hypothetical protein
VRGGVLDRLQCGPPLDEDSAPVRFVTRSTTRCFDGLAVSRFGPTVSLAPAASSVWQPARPALATTASPGAATTKNLPARRAVRERHGIDLAAQAGGDRGRDRGGAAATAETAAAIVVGLSPRRTRRETALRLTLCPRHDAQTAPRIARQ